MLARRCLPKHRRIQKIINFKFKIMFTNKNLFSNACKLVLCTVLLSTLFSCDTPQGERHKKDGYSIIEIDSCEYIEVSNWVGSQSGYYSITHKGNCKYCTQRNSK